MGVDDGEDSKMLEEKWAEVNANDAYAVEVRVKDTGGP